MSAPARHETRDVRYSLIAKVWAGLAVALLITGVLAGVAMRALRTPGTPVITGPRADPASAQRSLSPHLQPHPEDDAARLRAYEDALLTRTEWIDRSAGRVRIPIDRALELRARHEK